MPAGQWTWLELAKIGVDIIMPVALIFIGLTARKIAIDLERARWSSETATTIRVQRYDDIAPLLNKLFCFFTYRGDWKDTTPQDVLNAKRILDRQVHLSAPFFSPTFRQLYRDIILLMFDEERGIGRDAALRCSSASHKRYASYEWEPEWDSWFARDSAGGEAGAQERAMILSAYNRFLSQFSHELGLHLPMRTDAVERMRRADA